MTVSLNAYAVRVKKANTKREYEPLDSFSEKDADLLHVLHQILALRKKEFRKEDAQQVLQVVDLRPPKNRQLEGLLNIGQYGTASVIRNLNHWDQVAYNKGKSDVDLSPFYFLFDLPEGRDSGYLLLQRTGVEGAQAILAEALHDPFVHDFPDQRLHLNQVVPEKLFRQLEAEEVSEMQFIRHRAPRDITTAVGRKATVQTSGTMSLSVKFKDRLGMEAVRSFYDKHRGGESVLEFDDGDTRFPFETVKIKIKFRGKERTMDLGDPTKMRGSLDVTDQMKWSESGHPTFSSIAKAAKDLLLDLKNEPPRASR